MSDAAPRLRSMDDPDWLLSGLDPQQRDVATSQASRLAVIAGAGTGKTRAITHRIAYQVAQGRFSARSVLAVTFTTKAAGEMRGRLRDLGLPRVAARTFHSAALRQARHFWPQAMGGELPDVLGNRLPLVAEAASRTRLSTETPVLRDLSSEISWAKVSNVAPSDYTELSAAAGRELASASPAQIASAYARYEEIKSHRGVIDYEDILLCAAVVLSDHPDIGRQVRDTYRHVVVDEFQDVSPIQHKLLDLWTTTDSDLCVVGDPAQTIHSFAGAQATYLQQFSTAHPGAEIVTLVRDYRSTNQIVDVANKINTTSHTVQLQAQRGQGPEPEFVQHTGSHAEAESVADWVAQLHGLGVPYREQAVLYRIKAQSPAVEAALTQRGIPYQMRDAEGFYQRGEVRQALHLLTQRSRQSPQSPAESVVRDVLEGLGWTNQPPEGGGLVRERWESLASVAEAAFDAIDEEDTPIHEVVAELNMRAEAQQVPTADGVTLSTVHAAKGLEWDAVAIVGVQEGLLPFTLAQTHEQLEEERRLLYVGVTRARERLRLSWCRSYNGSRGQSRFLAGIGPRESVAPRRAVESTTRRRSKKCVVCGGVLGNGAEQKLRRHTDCPSTYDPAMLEALISWRKNVSREQSVPAYVIFTDATLVAVAESMPSTQQELLAIPGIGKMMLDRFGEDVLSILTGATGGQ